MWHQYGYAFSLGTTLTICAFEAKRKQKINKNTLIKLCLAELFRVSSVRLRICGKINDFIIAIEFYGLRSSVFRDVWMVRAISLRPRALEHQETHTVEKIHNDKHLTNRRKRRVARIVIPMLSLSLSHAHALSFK